MRPPLVKPGRSWALGAAAVVFTVAASSAVLWLLRPVDGPEQPQGTGSAVEHRPAGGSPQDVSPPAQATDPDEPTGELTAEEDLAINPPPPQEVRVLDVTGSSVELGWEPPPRVSSTHHYSDRVVGYRIYRRDDGLVDFRPLAVTDGTGYVDRAVRSGQTYDYVISSLHEQHVEGSRSDPPVSATVPG